MERGVALIARVVAQRDGQIELERLVTLEMAERMRREAEAVIEPSMKRTEHESGTVWMMANGRFNWTCNKCGVHGTEPGSVMEGNCLGGLKIHARIKHPVPADAP